MIPEKLLQMKFCSLTVDTPEDFERTIFILEKLYENDRFFYDDLVQLEKKENIPYYHLDPEMQVKLPEKTITLRSFQNMFEMRIQKSKKLYLEDRFYESKKPI